jgi:hypothetical protein
MNFRFVRRRRFWVWFISIAVLLPVLLFAALVGYVYWRQDAIVQAEIEAMNRHHQGLIVVGDTHVAPFENFPYISIKIDNVRIYESKADDASLILDVADIYIGFNIWDIVNGDYDVQDLVVEDGFFNIIRHKDGSINLQNALATPAEADEAEDEPMSINLKHIELRNLDIHKLDESSLMDVELFIINADGGFQTRQDEIAAHVDTEFELNIIEAGDTSFIKHKHFEFHTDLIFNEQSGVLAFKPSGIVMEHGDFELEGSIDTKNDMTVDLEIKGTKPSFDMLIAFAPEDLIPVLERYRNAGKIYFNAIVKGPTAGEQMPFIDATFGASEAYLENTQKGQRLDDMGFKGHFTNGAERSLRTMEFSLTDITAKPETGTFKGNLFVKNFEEPDIEMDLHADFDLQFLADFFNLSDIQDAHGRIQLDMKFHDIIDLNYPEKALNQLNQAYFSELKITNLRFRSPDLPAPLYRMDAHLAMTGKRAELKRFFVNVGNSTLNVTGFISDLPAVVHHTDIPVETHLELDAKMIDLAELSGFSKDKSSGIDEQIQNLRMAFSFNSSARNFTESEFLPIGEFFIDDLHASLKHYPHELHDFHADILIDDVDLKIVDFTGFIDDSDFHFNGLIHDYGFWMKDRLDGDVKLDITLKSDLLRLEDIFSYQGENYVPEDYRHEEIDNLVLHVNSAIHFKDHQLHSIDIDLDRLDAKMHLHPLRFEDFNGRIHYQDDHIMLQNFHGKLGRTVFDVNMNYYLGNNPAIKKRDNYLGLKANYMDFDQLFRFNLEAPGNSRAQPTQEVHTTADAAQHTESFNLYELPFTDMKFDFDIGHFIYHRIDLQNVQARLRTTHNHYLYVDTLKMNAAGGSIEMTGYFNGSDPKHIYLKPNLRVKNADIDKLMFKFENFGQDELVSENLHGRLSASITGNIRVYPDFVPDLDQSEIHLDVEVLNGRLENYGPVMVLSEYFGDKDLSSIRFDTLKNHLDITKGVLTIPSMAIETTLGHYELSGTQDMNDNIDYYIRIPWKVIKEAARYTLFGDKKTDDGETGDDEIIEVDPAKKTRYLNLRISGTIDDYKIKLSKPEKKK